MRGIRILLVGLTLLIGSWVGVSEGGRRLVARRLAAITGFDVVVGDVDINPFPPGFSLKDVRVRHPETRAAVLEVARIRAPAPRWLRFGTSATYRIVRPRLFAPLAADAAIAGTRAAAAGLLRDGPGLVRGAEIVLDARPTAADAARAEHSRAETGRGVETQGKRSRHKPPKLT
jgi:hypothetical protein